MFEKLQKFLRFGRTARVFDARVNVLRIFAEDHHVHFLRMLYRGRDARKILDGPQADVEVEQLAQRDVERTNPSANGRRERSFDADEEFLESLDGVVRQPIVESLLRRLARIDLEPHDLAPCAVRLLHSGFEYAMARRPNVRAGAIAADKGKNRIVRHHQSAVADGNFSARWRRNMFVGH